MKEQVPRHRDQSFLQNLSAAPKASMSITVFRLSTGVCDSRRLGRFVTEIRDGENWGRSTHCQLFLNQLTTAQYISYSQASQRP